jgi:hypothetical protein
MSELNGALFGARKTIFPEDAKRTEVLRYISQTLADKTLEPARQELASRILESVNAFMDHKLNLPLPDKEAFRNVPPFDIKISFRGDSILDFLEKVDFEIQFIVGGRG